MRPEKRSIAALSLFGVVLLAVACGREAGGAICTGGSRQVSGGCYCARGQQWDGAQCAGTPETGTCTQKGAMEVISPAGSVCFCPDGWIWTDGNRTECQPCGGGSLADGDQRCVCPAGLAWIDNACQQPQEQPQAQVQPQEQPQPTEAPPPAAAPPPVVYRQQTRQSTSNLTCCINHAKYQCPNDAAFRACATLSPNHGCARAGGC